jgi:GTPase SAR1 family protein
MQNTRNRRKSGSKKGDNKQQYVVPYTSPDSPPSQDSVDKPNPTEAPIRKLDDVILMKILSYATSQDVMAALTSVSRRWVVVSKGSPIWRGFYLRKVVKEKGVTPGFKSWDDSVDLSHDWREAYFRHYGKYRNIGYKTNPNSVLSNGIIRMAILGSDGVGKSAFLNRFRKGKYYEDPCRALLDPTQVKHVSFQDSFNSPELRRDPTGTAFWEVFFLEPKIRKSHIAESKYDRYNEMVSYHQGVNAIIIAFDLSDESPSDVQQWIILSMSLHRKDLAVMLVGMKSDTEEVCKRSTAKRLETEIWGLRTAKMVRQTYGCSCIYAECSSKNGDGVQLAMSRLFASLVKHPASLQRLLSESAEQTNLRRLTSKENEDNYSWGKDSPVKKKPSNCAIL